MQAEIILRNLLLSNSAITSAVGNRIASDRAEQDWQKPFIMFARSATEYDQTLDGTILRRSAKIEVQIWADTRLQASTIAQTIEETVITANHDVIDRNDIYDENLDDMGVSVNIAINEF